jgi:hypothetical protein
LGRNERSRHSHVKVIGEFRDKAAPFQQQEALNDVQQVPAGFSKISWLFLHLRLTVFLLAALPLGGGSESYFWTWKPIEIVIISGLGGLHLLSFE